MVHRPGYRSDHHIFERAETERLLASNDLQVDASGNQAGTVACSFVLGLANMVYRSTKQEDRSMSEVSGSTNSMRTTRGDCA